MAVQTVHWDRNIHLIEIRDNKTPAAIEREK